MIITKLNRSSHPIIADRALAAAIEAARAREAAR